MSFFISRLREKEFLAPQDQLEEMGHLEHQECLGLRESEENEETRDNRG